MNNGGTTEALHRTENILYPDNPDNHTGKICAKNGALAKNLYSVRSNKNCFKILSKI